MLVYKYRGGSDGIFERDLNSLEKNYFWSSKFEDLNDPQENLILIDKFVKQSSWLTRIFGKKSSEAPSKVQEDLENILSHNNIIGIYSLSTSFIDKLLWAHYANSHKGFCIEYDLDLLLDNYVYENKYSFPVIYSVKPSQIALKDIPNASKNDDLIQKAFGSKSKEWEYEQEYRIITDDFGIHNYDFQAVKSIYFGLRMCDLQKELIIKRLRGRGIKYYQIVQMQNKYELGAVPLDDKYSSDLTYLKQIPKEITKSKTISYSILEKFYIKCTKIAEMRIELEDKISKEVLESLCGLFVEHLFQNAESVNIIYYLKTQEEYSDVWATTHIKSGKMEILINQS